MGGKFCSIAEGSGSRNHRIIQGQAAQGDTQLTKSPPPVKHRAIFANPAGTAPGLDGAAHTGPKAATHSLLHAVLPRSLGYPLNRLEHGQWTAGVK